MKIRYGAVPPVPAEEAFAFVADPVNWPLPFPACATWRRTTTGGRVGGHARLTSVVLGMSRTMGVELTEWDPPRLPAVAAEHRNLG